MDDEDQQCASLSSTTTVCDKDVEQTVEKMVLFDGQDPAAVALGYYHGLVRLPTL